MEQESYAPLPGRAYGPLYASRLYMGRDHLLKSSVVGFHENLRRFAWEDIQAFVLRKTPAGMAINAVLGACVFTLAVFFLNYSGRSLGAALAYLPFVAVFLALLIVNLRLGPTCTVHLQTAVSFEPLPSLYREAVARRAIEVMAPRILARQSPEGYQAPAAEPPPSAAPPPMTGRSAWHLAAWALLGATAVLFAADALAGSRSVLGTALGGFFGGTILSIAVVIAQIRKPHTAALRTYGWLNLSYHFLSGMVLAMVAFAALVSSGGKGFHLRGTHWYDTYLYTALPLAAMLLAFGLFVLPRSPARAARG